MTLTAIENVRVFDGVSDLGSPCTVMIEGDRIREVLTDRRAPGADVRIDGWGGTLLPGLIDAHIHAYAQEVNLLNNDKRPITQIAHRAQAMLRDALSRGFTTVRDCGGADYGLWLALRDRLFQGPRLYFCGRMLSQTGGHGDFRHPHAHDSFEPILACGCGHAGHVSAVVDGEPDIRRAVRESLRRGASFIKFAASGGVTSVAGGVRTLQFSDSEIRAIVDEVERFGVYCTAHVHPDEGIRRAISLGVHCIEHASMIQPETASLASERGTFVVPTLAVASAIERHGASLGYAPESLEKLREVKASMQDGLRALKMAGVAVGFGTDLLGPLEKYQGLEFIERSTVYTPIEILRQATSINARILRVEDMLGVVRSGALADVIVVRGNPLSDLVELGTVGSRPQLVVQGGIVVSDLLT